MNIPAMCGLLPKTGLVAFTVLSASMCNGLIFALSAGLSTISTLTNQCATTLKNTKQSIMTLLAKIASKKVRLYETDHSRNARWNLRLCHAMGISFCLALVLSRFLS